MATNGEVGTTTGSSERLGVDSGYRREDGDGAGRTRRSRARPSGERRGSAGGRAGAHRGNRAPHIARAAIRRAHDDPSGFLSTERARELYRAVLALLQDRTVTDYGAKRLETLYPSGVPSRIEEVRQFAGRAIEREPEVLNALEDVAPLGEPSPVRVRDRCLVTTNAERYAEAREQVPELSVEIVEEARGLAELTRGYATVVALDEAFAGVDIEGNVRVVPDALANPEEVVLERTLALFAHNREQLRAAAAVHRHADLEPPCDLKRLEGALERLNEDGTIAGDAELDRLVRAVVDLDDAVAAAECVADDRLRATIAERDVTIEGTDLLSLVDQGTGVDSLLSQELADEYADAVDAAREHAIDAIGLSEEAALAQRIFDDEPTFSVRREDEAVRRLRTELETECDRRATRLKRDLAVDLAGLHTAAEELVRAALSLDVELAIARFAREFECTMPDVDGEGIAIEGDRSPLLDVPFEEVEPVAYAVEGVTVLSGVNSGGKTLTLDLVGICVILAHMGLPVPAERARVKRVDHLHYRAKSQGTSTAGRLRAPSGSSPGSRPTPEPGSFLSTNSKASPSPARARSSSPASSKPWSSATRPPCSSRTYQGRSATQQPSRSRPTGSRPSGSRTANCG